jgi:hypothetical protein
MPPPTPETNPEQYVRIERVSTIEERLGKTYSLERFEEFQEAVEKIVSRVLETDTAHAKMQHRIQTEIKEYLDKKAWQNKTFWIPTAIAAVAVLVAIFKP